MPVSETSPVLIIGGTRGTGALIAQLLVSRGTAVRVLARHPTRAAQRLDRSIEIVPGDMTKPATLPACVAGVRAVILTAGYRSGRPARRATIKAIEYDGVLNVIDAALAAHLTGRFLYMTASSVGSRSLAAVFLNLYKGNTLVWRQRVEERMRASGLDYTIIRAGVLLNRPGGQHDMRVTQDALPLSIRHRIARSDVADVFVAALEHPCASRKTFDVVWGAGPPRLPASRLLDALCAAPH